MVRARAQVSHTDFSAKATSEEGRASQAPYLFFGFINTEAMVSKCLSCSAGSISPRNGTSKEVYNYYS